MTANQVVVRVISALEQFHIPYMLVGSYSSNAFGSPRSTQDADFVIELGDRLISPLFASLAPDIAFDPQMRLETVTMTYRYVGTHAASGFKIELFMTSSDAHDRERFARRQRQPFLGGHAFLPTPEDVLIQKLRWFDRSRRAKDLDDARNVLAIQRESLDMDYLHQWCGRHGTSAILDQLKAEIG